MGLIQDVSSRVWVEWRRESVVIGESSLSDAGSSESSGESCEIGYEDLQALASVLASSTQAGSRFIEWEQAREKGR